MNTFLDVINSLKGILKKVVLECLNVMEKAYYWPSEMKTKNRILK